MDEKELEINEEEIVENKEKKNTEEKSQDSENKEEITKSESSDNKEEQDDKTPAISEENEDAFSEEAKDKKEDQIDETKEDKEEITKPESSDNKEEQEDGTTTVSEENDDASSEETKDKKEDQIDETKEDKEEITKSESSNNEEEQEDETSKVSEENNDKKSDEKAVKKESNFKFIKILWKIIKTILILVLIVIFFVIIVQRVTNNKASVGGYGVYTIVSESMVPEYNIYDMLIAKKTNPQDIAIGDDVVYQGKEGDFNGKIVTHRVIKKKHDGKIYSFVTKGIANPVEDPEISEDQIYGKVLVKSQILSTASKVLNTTYGFYFIIFVPIVIMVTLEIIDTVNERKKLKRN